MLWARVLADVIVVVHAAYVGFVVIGLVAILVGLVLRRGWARNFWLRAVHLAMILIVVAESWIGLACPLTTWENALRRWAGQASYPGDFLGHWAHRLIFVRAEPWALTAPYSLFALAVAATFVLGPPRWPGRRTAHP